MWTAPELLRMTSKPPNGTQKADIYSLGIILQEIVYRCPPFFMDTKTPKGTAACYSHYLFHCNNLSIVTHELCHITIHV